MIVIVFEFIRLTMGIWVVGGLLIELLLGEDKVAWNRSFNADCEV